MLIYKDVCTGDELFSDAYKLAFQDEDFLITVQAKMTTKKAESVDAGMIGGNPSAEDDCADEGVDDSSSVSGLDLALAQDLKDQSDYFVDKKMLQNYLKKFVKNVSTKLAADEEAEKNAQFKKECGAKLKSFLALFDPAEDTIYTGSKFDPEDAKSCPMIGKWNPDGMGVTFYLMKSALYEEKQ